MNSRLIIRIAIFFTVFLFIFLIAWIAVDAYRNDSDNGLSVNSNFSAGLISAQNLVSGDSDLSNISDDLKPLRDWSIGDADISAKAAICMETNPIAKGKIILAKNADEKLPIASLTKLMSALVVLKNGSGDFNLDKLVNVSLEAVEQPGEQGFLIAGEYLSVKDLLYIMLIESSNDAAYALAQVIGVDNFVFLMNQEATGLGMDRTSFSDPSGFSADNYSTVMDLVKLTQYLTKNYPLVWEILSKQNFELNTPQGFHHEMQNTNELLGQVPGIIGGKTGKTTEAKGCLLLVLKNPKSQNNLVYIILGSDERFSEMKRLIEWINIAYHW